MQTISGVHNFSLPIEFWQAWGKCKDEEWERGDF